MKKLILIPILMLATISLGAFLVALHSHLFDVQFEQCKANLLADNNYKTIEQAFDCAENSIPMKILGTFLFKEGSILK